MKCLSCDMEVKAYRVKRGGLPSCNPVDDEGFISSKEDIIVCPKCKTEIPNTIICIYCSAQLHPIGWRP